MSTETDTDDDAKVDLGISDADLSAKAREAASELVADNAALGKRLDTVASAVMAILPERVRASLAGETPFEKLTHAIETDAFRPAPVPSTDDGRARISPVTPDPSSLPPVARISAGYNSK